MKYAIIQSGSRQHRAVEGETIEVERLGVAEGETLEIESVLLIADEGAVQVGRPHIPGAKVTATVLGEIRGPKVRIFKYKAKERYRRRAGHRQNYTRLKVNSISG